MSERRILVLNSHEAWVSQLEGLPFEFDIAVGLSGRTLAGWDERMRPIPRNARVLDIKDALLQTEPYRAAIGHSVTDLLELKRLEIPKLLILHTTIEGRLAETPGAVSAKRLSDEAKKYLKLIRGHVVAISPLKQRSWNMTSADVVRTGINVDDYPVATQEKAHGLRISNHFNKRRRILLADFHDACFSDLPIEFVGENDDMVGVSAATDWADLKRRIAQARFYIHTAEIELEDGYNMASVEAMACGLPVLGNRHPSSVIEHGVTGFLSDDSSELRGYAEQLLRDRELSLRMGRAAREQVAEIFSHERFVEGMVAALARSKKKFYERPPGTRKSKAKKRRK